MIKTVIFSKWNKTEGKINTILNKFKKNNIQTDFKFKVISEPRKEIRSQTVLLDDDDTLGTREVTEKYEVEVVDVEFSGELPILNGWEVIGRIEKLPENNILVIGDIPTKYREHDLKICEHCNHKRARNTVYILESNGVTKAIGSTCIKDFTGHGDAESIIALASLMEVVDLRDKMEWSSGKKVTKTKNFIELCAQAIIQWNYCNANSEAASTKDIVLNRTTQLEVSEEARELAKQAIERCKNFTPNEMNNSFKFNMNTIANSEYIYDRQLGIASYIVENHRVKREKEAVENKKYENVSNEHVGEIKKRLDFELTYLSTQSFANNYGTTYFHKFNDSEGNEITWKGSKDMFWACNGDVGTDFKNNEQMFENKMVIKGTITQHTEFRGRKSTLINRCKFLKVT